MPQNRTRRRLAVEGLEPRLALSGTPTPVPTLANVIGQASGVVGRPHAVAEVQTTIAPRDLLRGRHATILGLYAHPAPGGSLQPRFVSATGPGGAPAHFRTGASYRSFLGLPAVGFAKVKVPGTVTAGVTGRHGTTGPFTTQTALVGDVNGDGKVDFNDEQLFATAFLSHAGDANYILSADANRNGFIGHDDGVAIVRNFPPLSPKVPLKLDLRLAPEDTVLHPGASVSGGATRNRNVTIIGHTTPGSLIFNDNGLGDYNFNDRVFVTDARGFFTISQDVKDLLTNTEYLVYDPFGQQIIRAFPILRLTH